MRSQVSPGDVRAALPPAAPEQGEPFSAVLADLDRVVLPGVTHWQHPGFFGYFPANTSGPSVLGDLVSAGLGVQGMSWVTSPAATELEQHVMDWLADLLGLPASFRSDRHRRRRRPGLQLRRQPRRPARRAAPGQQGRHRCGTASSPSGPPSTSPPRRTPRWRRPSASPASAPTPSASSRSTATWPCARARSPPRLERDVARGYTPVLVCATVGTTSTTAVDPLAELGPICQKHGVWLHVDAAYAGVSAVVPELRELQAGVEWADSYTTDAHKWLLTGFDATLFWVADRAALTGALSILPEYLRNAATDAGAVVDFRDWQIPLGRRFRALKLWFVLRWYGAEGLRAHIRGHVALAQELAGWAEADERFDVATPHPLSLVCLRPRWADDVDADVATMTLLERLNDGGEVFLTHTTVGGSVGAAGRRRRPGDHPGARRAGLDAAARGPRLAGRRLRGGRRRARGRAAGAQEAAAPPSASAAAAPRRERAAEQAAADETRPSRRGRRRRATADGVGSRSSRGGLAEE